MSDHRRSELDRLVGRVYPELKRIAHNRLRAERPDHMIWPEAIERAIACIEEAPFLTQRQKRDVLYWNAARFLRLDEEAVARHHGHAGSTGSGL